MSDDFALEHDDSLDMSDDRPAAVRTFETALADWLASFTMPEALAGEMADACADGAAWAAAIAGVAARRAGWDDTEAFAWGLCVGGLAGAVEAGQRSLADSTAAGAKPALPLLAADGLVAAAHEVLGALPPERAREALAALDRGFGDGGPWLRVAEITEGPAAGRAEPAWPALVPCALALAGIEEPGGPWTEWAAAWEDRRAVDPRELWDDPRADRETKALLRHAARAARSGQ